VSRPRRRRLRLWPQGLAGRITLLVVACLLVLGLVAGGIVIAERGRQAIEHFALALSNRMVAMVELIEDTPTSQRARLQTALSGGGLRVRVQAERPPGPGWGPPGRVYEDSARYLAPLAPRPVFVRIGKDHDHRHRFLERRRGPWFAAAVGLKDGTWAVFVAHPPRRPWRLGPLFWFGLTTVLVLLAVVWGTHRMTRPMRRFAAAADRLGLDASPEPLPEHGPRELRNATRAFNRMTARIRRLVDDRTLMLAAISHDLKTMLTRLRLRAEFIDDGEQQAKAIADLDEMQAMLEATLSFARDDAADEAPVRVDLAALLQSLTADAADADEAASYDGPDRLGLLGRPVALRRCFANLIDNALRYGGEAEVALAVSEGEAIVSVADRGPGIARELRERVFDPFFRVEASRSRETGGSGLGLAVVRAIIQRHGGSIVLDDRAGGGLLVTVTLPLDTTGN